LEGLILEAESRATAQGTGATQMPAAVSKLR
jgi:hypothetical protein